MADTSHATRELEFDEKDPNDHSDEITTALQTRPFPSPTDAEDGLRATVIVLRRIYEVLEPHGVLDQYKEARAFWDYVWRDWELLRRLVRARGDDRNMILEEEEGIRRRAIASLRETENEASKKAAEKGSVIEQYAFAVRRLVEDENTKYEHRIDQSLMTYYGPDPYFKAMINCETISKAIWFRDDMLSFSELVIKEKVDGVWQYKKSPAPKAKAAVAGYLQLELDRWNHEELQTLINDEYKWQMSPDNLNYAYIQLFSEPKFMRIRFTTKNPVSLHDVQRVEIRTARYDESAPERVRMRITGYNLVALVRLQRGRQPDYVWTWGVDGLPIPNLRDEWYVDSDKEEISEAAGHFFMLFEKSLAWPQFTQHNPATPWEMPDPSTWAMAEVVKWDRTEPRAEE